MIAKITRGARVGQLAGYLHGPGRAEEHVHDRRAGGAVIGGNLGVEGDRDGATWAAALSDAAASRPSITTPIWHASLRTAPGDRVLSDAEWADAAQDFAQAMGYEKHPWVVVRHGEDHVHVVVSRVDFEGGVWRASHDYRAAQAACTQLEHDYGLSAAPRRTSEVTRRAPDHQLTAGEWRRGVRVGRAPERVQLAEVVRTAATAAAGQGREGFEKALDAAGVEHRVNVAATGRVSGYSFHAPGHTDAAGEAVWFKSSQLGRELSWNRIAPVLETPLVEQGVVPVVEVPKRVLETKAHHQQRTADAQQVAAEEMAARALAAVPAQVGERVAADDSWWTARRAQGGRVVAAVAARVATEETAVRLAAQHAAWFPRPPTPGPAPTPGVASAQGTGTRAGQGARTAAERARVLEALRQARDRGHGR